MWRFLFALAVACRSSSAAAPDPCTPAALDLSKVVSLAGWQPPTGCALARAVDRAILRSQSDLDAVLRCDRDVAMQPFDFTRGSLLVTSWKLSPAAVDLLAYDDGATVTLVDQSREACPGDSHPAPVSLAKWFVLAGSNAQRNLATSECTVPSQCK